MNIASTLTQGRRDYPERPAILFEGHAISYAALDRSASRVARTLRRLGVDRGDRVALLLPNVPAFAYAYFGALKIGAIAVSINTGLSAGEIRFALDDSGATALITTEGMRESVTAWPDPDRPRGLQAILITDIDELVLEGEHVASLELIEPIDLEPDAPAVIVYTSGTTGVPKGATLSHGNVMFVMAAKQRCLGIGPDDRLLLFLPLYHCFGQNAILNAALYAGATVVLQRGFEAAQVLDAFTRDGATMLFGVPATFIVLLDRIGAGARAELGTLRYCFSAAAPLPVSVETAWRRKFGFVIYQGYGLTETSPFASYNHVATERHQPGSIGMPIDGVEMRVVDVATHQPLPAGELGEIAIRGANVMLGYWQRPADTAEVIRDGWFHSGDIGRMDAQGYFFIEDRLKDLIIVGGSNVYPAEVERVLQQHPAVLEVAVYGVPDAVLGEQVRAAIVLATGAFATAGDLIAWCRANIAAFKAPAGIEVVSELPRNRTGKVLKRVLRDRYTEKSAARAANEAAIAAGEAESAPDAQTIQRWIASWLTDVLGKGSVPSAHAAGTDAPAVSLRTLRAGEQFDLNRPLSEYGVSSLIAVDLAGALGAWLGRPVTPTLAWHHPTIRTIASHLAAGRDAGSVAWPATEATASGAAPAEVTAKATPSGALTALAEAVAKSAPDVATLTASAKAPEPTANVAALAALSEAAAEAMLIETLARLRG